MIITYANRGATTTTPYASDVADLGSTTAEWRRLFLGDQTNSLQFGVAQDVVMGRIAANVVGLAAGDSFRVPSDGELQIGADTGLRRVAADILGPVAGDSFRVASATLQVRNPADSFSYTIVGGAITGNRNVTLPFANLDLTVAMLEIAQVFTSRIDSTFQHTWSAGEASTTSFYQIGRDADAINQLHFNVPTGAGMEWSVNDVPQMTLSSLGVLAVLATTGNTLVVDTSVLVVDATNNRVGINTTAPGMVLTVRGVGINGDFRVETNLGTARFEVQADGATVFISSAGADAAVVLRVNDSERMRLTATGNNITIGSTTVGVGAATNVVLGGGVTTPVIGAATADLVHLAGVDFAAVDRRLYVQSEVGSPIIIGNNAVRTGLAGTATGSFVMSGITSGVVTVTVAAVAGTWTMQLPAAVGTAGQQLTDAAGDGITSWAAAASLREHKNIHGVANPQDALGEMLGARAYRFHYKEGFGTRDYHTEYVGIMADEAPWAMHYGGSIVNPVNALGYMVLGFQAMHKRINQLERALVGAGIALPAGED